MTESSTENTQSNDQNKAYSEGMHNFIIIQSNVKFHGDKQSKPFFITITVMIHYFDQKNRSILVWILKFSCLLQITKKISYYSSSNTFRSNISSLLVDSINFSIIFVPS